MHFNSIAAPTFVGAVCLFWLGSWLERKLTSGTARFCLWLAGLALAIPAILFTLYYTHLFDHAVWFYSFRALPFTELMACGIGLIMGALFSWFQPETLSEKLVAPIATALFVFVPFVKPILVPLDFDHLSEQSTGEICLQSAPSTCGPSSAAMILRMLGQPASEKELARECFTYRGGTEIWYVARAFRRRGFDAKFLIQPAESNSLPSPAIAGVVLTGGAGHFIAILDGNSSEVTIADPLKGKMIINKAELRHRYNFTGFFLVVHPQ